MTNYTNRGLARLYLEIDGRTIKTETVCRTNRLPRLSVGYPYKSGAYDGIDVWLYKAGDGETYVSKTGDLITRYWKWENEQ